MRALVAGAVLALAGILLTALPAAAQGGQISYNWSGYVSEAGAPSNPNIAGSGGQPYVTGQWKVPRLTCPRTGVSDVVVWVGVGGWNGPDLFQTGTESACVNGRQSASAWWADNSTDLVGPGPLFTVTPGDLMRARLWENVELIWSYSIVDLTSGKSSSALEEADWGVKGSVEWIVERPQDMATNKPYALADFGTVRFSHCYPIYQAMPIALTTPSGDPMALPGDLSASGFEVAQV